MKYSVKDLTLDEKLRLLTGKDYWHLETANGKLPKIRLADGPHGLRVRDKTDESRFVPVTAFPCLSVLANTWDLELAYLQGNTIADDCIENGADVLLAPGVNMKRTPLCGRNFEYLSEDPFLAGVLAKSYIEGVQSKGVGTSLKHFCCNNLEYERFYLSSEVDERALREIYLPAFETALEAKPWTVMCAYNAVNGVFASENEYTLRDILRDEFGFDGLIVSDWEAVRSSWRATKATLDLRMPYSPNAYDELKTAYDNGWLTEEEIDARVTKILEFIAKPQNDEKKVTTTKAQRHENAVEIARAGIVLLKNEDDILPLQSGNILVDGIKNTQPVLGGGGSSLAPTDYKSKTLVEELAARMPSASVYSSRALLFSNYTYETSRARKDIYEKAYRADTVVLCLGTNGQLETESYDRQTLRLPVQQEEMIINTSKINKNLVVVLNVGSAIDMRAWINEVKAVVLAGFGGEGMHEAVADILSGKACPMGKLSETYPLCLEDTPSIKDKVDGYSIRYEESVFIGYRWYDKKQKEVLFPFGHGLSYAAFDYSDLQVKKITETDYEVSFTVKNSSAVDGAEISQVYVRDPFASVPRPEKELKGFAKTVLKAGENKRVHVTLNARSFAYYSTVKKGWYVENGDFEILVGASSKDIRLTKRIVINLPPNEQQSQ